MKLFISWSGSKSNQVAVVLRNWLRQLFPTIEPFLSTDNLKKGTQWSDGLLTGLNQAEHGLICLTRQNYQEPWILFEAGAIARKAHSTSKVWTILIGDLVTEHLQGSPLSLFQHTLVDKTDMLRLCKEINALQEHGKRTEPELQGEFDSKWKNLEKEITKITGESKMEPRAVRISELAVETQIIAGRIFEDVIIRGPAILYMLEGCHFKHCRFASTGGSIEQIIWKKASSEAKQYLIGAIGISRVKFIRCTFEGVGIAGPEAFLSDIRSIPEGPRVLENTKNLNLD
ncbi:MAG: hypothetical protein NPIRA04_24840 [Nitrospirales bacterium]|nr:MAG: hypothetical protein NPIRA04_24840 [Nitrospirales bacterium]